MPYCRNCGQFIDSDATFCPECGSKDIQRLRRVTGYLTGNYTTAFNYGKQKEVEDNSDIKDETPIINDTEENNNDEVLEFNNNETTDETTINSNTQTADHRGFEP